MMELLEYSYFTNRVGCVGTIKGGPLVGTIFMIDLHTGRSTYFCVMFMFTVHTVLPSVICVYLISQLEEHTVTLRNLYNSNYPRQIVTTNS
jgi:hypothetical protein